eukprot:COSAG01_NODE_12663_length_1702_cov_4.179663_2_plen_75_part_00
MWIVDIIGDSLEDIKEIVKVLDSQFGHNGNSGVKVIDPKEVLGVRRIEGTDGKVPDICTCIKHLSVMNSGIHKK